MANFELRIYILDHEKHEVVAETFGVTDVEYLTDEQFVEASEENGRVYSLHGFLGNDVVAFDKDIVRAYFIDTEDENATPIRADGYNTTFHADLIKQNEQVLYLEVKANPENRGTKTYTIIVTKTKDTSTDEVLDLITNIEDVTSASIVTETVDSTKLRLEVETESYFDYDVLEGTIDNYGGLDCEFIKRVDNF